MGFTALEGGYVHHLNLFLFLSPFTKPPILKTCHMALGVMSPQLLWQPQQPTRPNGRVQIMAPTKHRLTFFPSAPETSVHWGRPRSEPWSKNPTNLQELEFCEVCSQTRTGPTWKSIIGSYLKSPIWVRSTAHLKTIRGQREMTKQIGKCYELDEHGNTTPWNLWKRHKQWLKDFCAASDP